jgi:uncharacterized low-complexity protein
MRRVPAALLLALAMAAPAAAAAPPESNDLREFRVGMAVDEMPRTGYLGFACAAGPGRMLDSWQGYGQCPAETSGWHAVRFQYDEAANPLAKVNGLYEGTKVGGHPVLLTALIGDDGRLKGLVIETDPAARLYLRKKAFLFGEQVKARYGDAGWTCASQQPSADQEPVGGVFMNEHCEKATATRRLTLDRVLFRRAGQELKDFVSRSRLEILGRGDGEAARISN